jgi:hypothetical protein
MGWHLAAGHRALLLSLHASSILEGLLMTIKELVKDNRARFAMYQSGRLWYDILTKIPGVVPGTFTEEKKIASFPVNIEDKADIGGTAFNAEYKAITLMRYIRKAQKSGQLVIFK